MVQYPDGRLNASFAALSDATRRGVLERLGRGDVSMRDLAQTFHMTLTGMRKHVGLLEHAELVTTEKVGRVRTCPLGPPRLEDETAGIEQQRRLWGGRVDAPEPGGRVRTCGLARRRLADEMVWIEQQRGLWDARFDTLEQVVAERRWKERN